MNDNTVKLTDKYGIEEYVNPDEVNSIQVLKSGETALQVGEKFIYFYETPEALMKMLGLEFNDE
tara:strand:+ start:312 stop:503 length:192 start_codon:yes stop_codon:yes gene_type:complete